MCPKYEESLLASVFSTHPPRSMIQLGEIQAECAPEIPGTHMERKGNFFPSKTESYYHQPFAPLWISLLIRFVVK